MSSTTTNFPTSSGPGWTNHFNCLNLDGSVATDNGAPTTDLLTVFGATMPSTSGSGINGIEVQIWFSGSFTVSYIKLRKNGIPVGNNLAAGQGPTPSNYTTIGGPWETWSAGFASGDGFGIELTFDDDSSGNTVSVDHIRAIIYYDNVPSNTYNESGTGGVVCAGASSTNTVFNNAGSGGVVCGGQSKLPGLVEASASGSIDATGSVDGKFYRTIPFSMRLVPSGDMPPEYTSREQTGTWEDLDGTNYIELGEEGEFQDYFSIEMAPESGTFARLTDVIQNPYPVSATMTLQFESLAEDYKVRATLTANWDNEPTDNDTFIQDFSQTLCTGPGIYTSTMNIDDVLLFPPIGKTWFQLYSNNDDPEFNLPEGTRISNVYIDIEGLEVIEVHKASGSIEATGSCAAVVERLAEASGEIAYSGFVTTDITAQAEGEIVYTGSCAGEKVKVLPTSGGVRVGGTGRRLFHAKPKAVGTVEVIGTATSAKHKGAFASGSITYSGSVDPVISYRPRVAGEIEATGSVVPACTYVKRGTGGVVAGGRSNIGRKTDDVGSGGVVAAGLAKQTVLFNQRGIGGVVVAGTARQTSVSNPRVSGGVVAGGRAIRGKDYAATAAGSVDFTANFAPRIRYRPRVLGAIVASGAVSALQTIGKTGKGGVKIGGTATFGVIKSAVAAGSITSSGVCIGSKVQTVSGSGGVVASGTCSAGRILSVAASGGVVAAGSVTNTKTQHATAVGSVVASGSCSAVRNTVASASGVLSYTGSCAAVSNQMAYASGSIAASGKVSYWQHIGQGLRTYLLSKPEITELVEQRIYPNHPPQGVFVPWITYTIESNLHEHALDGASGIAMARIELEITADSAEDRLTIANALHTVLQGETGLYGAVEVLSVELDDSADDELLIEDGDLFTRKMDFVFVYRESIPRVSNIVAESTGTLVEGIVSSLSDLANVYPDKLPQKHRGTAIVYRKTGDNDLPLSLDGHDANVDAPTVDLVVYGDRYLDVAELSEQIRLRLQGLSGAIGEVGIWSCVLDDEGDTFSQKLPNGTRWWNTMSFSIFVES